MKCDKVGENVVNERCGYYDFYTDKASKIMDEMCSHPMNKCGSSRCKMTCYLHVVTW